MSKKTIKIDPFLTKLQLNVKPDLVDSRDYQYRTFLNSPGDKKALEVIVPFVRDNRSQYPPPRDQGRLGSCAAFATTSALEHFYKERTKHNAILSPLAFYYHTRELSNTVNVDSGSYMRDVCKIACEQGATLEQLHPYDPAKFTEKPAWYADMVAGIFKCKSYWRITQISEIKEALARNHTILLGMAVYPSISKAAQNGWIPLRQGTEQLLGGHAVECVGYDDNEKYLIIRNSWGTLFGENGYLYMPYDYFTKEVFDAWVLMK